MSSDTASKYHKPVTEMTLAERREMEKWWEPDESGHNYKFLMGKLLTGDVEERRSAAISFHNKMTNNTERRWMAEYVYPTKPWKGKSLIEAMQETEKWMNEREERHCLANSLARLGVPGYNNRALVWEKIEREYTEHMEKLEAEGKPKMELPEFIKMRIEEAGTEDYPGARDNWPVDFPAHDLVERAKKRDEEEAKEAAKKGGR